MATRKRPKRPAAGPELRKRYRDPKRYSDQRIEAKARATLGLEATEPEFDQVEVVTVEGPNGPVRLYVDQVDEHRAIWAEMAAAKAEGGGS